MIPYDLAKHHPNEHILIDYKYHWKQQGTEQITTIGARGYISRIIPLKGLEGGFVPIPESVKDIPEELRPKTGYGYDVKTFIALEDIVSITHLSEPSYH